MFRVLIAAVTLFVAQQAGAACVGADLLAEMPAQNRARLERAAAAQPFPNGLIWRAEKDDRVIHLVGTLHVADPRHTRTMQQITPLIERSKTIFLEVGNGDEARLQAKIARDPGVAFIVDGPTLPDLLPEADWQTLRRAMADRGVPGFLAAKMQPWMATVSLGMSKCAFQQALQKKPGLDQLILDHADAIGNPAQALEPFDTALGLFAAYTLEEQLDILRLSLTAETAAPEDMHATLVEAYFRGEVRIIWEFSLDLSLSAPGFSREKVLEDAVRMEDALITRRNRQWLTRILPAAELGEVFVAAGALHLPGDTGLLRLLELEGYRIVNVPF